MLACVVCAEPSTGTHCWTCYNKLTEFAGDDAVLAPRRSALFGEPLAARVNLFLYSFKPPIPAEYVAVDIVLAKDHPYGDDPDMARHRHALVGGMLMGERSGTPLPKDLPAYYAEER